AEGRWRRALVAGGFPVSALVLGAGPALPAWAWLLCALPLLLAYPLRTWRDAPFFPTPADALAGLDQVVQLAPGARVLDAGCGLGHGLQALRRAWPQAQLVGIEFSRPLAWAARWRCRDAEVQRADMWAASWAGVDCLYLFQRPESMARAIAKAEAEMAAGRWFVSLEFEVPGRRATARLGAPGARPVWIYRLGGTPPGSTGRPSRR
ncbi:MAG: class I SAM-dependent methyltransferase, partial [Rubrivivax sp.]